MKLLRQFLLLAMGVLALFPAIAGTTGRITGFLKDNTGMPVVGGKLTLVDKVQGKSVIATTDRNGAYGFPVVLPGAYNIHAEASGFVPQDRSAVIHVDSILRIDLVLEAEKDQR
jgi:hypothetical protein